MKYQFFYKEKEDHTLCLLRCFGQSPIVEIPDEIDGKVVSEIGDSCFSQNKKYKEYIETTPIDYSCELCGRYIEEVYLPKTITKIGSWAFYNCRSLKKLSIHEIDEVGSDAFMNCIQLHTLHVSSSKNMKAILTQINWDVEVHFSDYTLFYPEFYESFEELGPAHLFGVNIEGEGYRMRQCFKDGNILFDEYDATFLKLKSEEREKTVCQFVYNRLLYPVQCNCIEEYKEYVLLHQSVFSSFVSMDQMEYCIQKGYITSSTMDDLIEEASNQKKIEYTTYLIQLKKKYFRKKKQYDFEDF